MSPRQICTDNFTRCHTDIESTDQAFGTDAEPARSKIDFRRPGVWRGKPLSIIVHNYGMTWPPSQPATFALETHVFPSGPLRPSENLKKKCCKQHVSKYFRSGCGGEGGGDRKQIQGMPHALIVTTKQILAV